MRPDFDPGCEDASLYSPEPNTMDAIVYDVVRALNKRYHDRFTTDWPDAERTVKFAYYYHHWFIAPLDNDWIFVYENCNVSKYMIKALKAIGCPLKAEVARGNFECLDAADEQRILPRLFEFVKKHRHEILDGVLPDMTHVVDEAVAASGAAPG